MAKCHCGKELHYTDQIIMKRMEKIVEIYGETLFVMVNGRIFKVPRHFIVLHDEFTFEDVDKFGFEEISW